MQSLLSTRSIVVGFGLLLIIAAGVAGGIFLGFRLTQPTDLEGSQQYAQTGAQRISGVTADDLSLRPGDLFPLEAIQSAGIDTTFDAVLFGHRTVVLLVALGCSHCDDLLSFWQQHITQSLSSDIRVVVGVGTSHGDIAAGYLALMPSMTVVRYDERHFSELRYVNIFPSMYCLDQDGFIETIQAGFSGEINPAVLTFLTGQR